MIDKLEKMRLGRKKNYLKKCIIVIDLLAQHENTTTIRKRVFEEHIKPIIFCSYVQFNNMLNEPNPHKQIEEIEAKIQSFNEKESDTEDLGGANIRVLPNPKEAVKVDNWDWDIDLLIE